jgi:hypothetical protein
MVSGWFEAGPMVATIFVRDMLFLYFLRVSGKVGKGIWVSNFYKQITLL